MATLTSSSFSFREMLQVIMPTLVGLCLFVPLFEPPTKTVDITLLVFGGIILSFVVAGLAAAAADLAIEPLLLLHGGLKNYRAERGWVEANWDIGRLEAHMTKDEHEAVDLIGSYMISTKIIAFYLLAYFLVNLCWLAFGLYDAPDGVGDAAAAGGATGFLRTAWGVRTPIVGGWLLSTVVVLVAAPASIIFLLADYLGKYAQLFLRGGWYDTMAAKHHAEAGDIARNVWGRVTEKKDGKAVGVGGLDVTLSAVGGQVVGGPAKTDKAGYFQHENAFAACRGGYELEVAQTCEEKTEDGALTTKYSVMVVAPASLIVTSLEGKGRPDVLISVVRVKTEANGAGMPDAGRVASGGANTTDAAPPVEEQGIEAEHNSSAGQRPVQEVSAEPPPVEADTLKPATIMEAAAEEAAVLEAAETTSVVSTDVGGAKGDETQGGGKPGS